MKSLALVNPEITVRVYDDCTDPECLAKYGMQSKSIIIINEQKAVTTLSKKAVRKAFDTALKSLK